MTDNPSFRYWMAINNKKLSESGDFNPEIRLRVRVSQVNPAGLCAADHETMKWALGHIEWLRAAVKAAEAARDTALDALEDR